MILIDKLGCKGEAMNEVNTANTLDSADNKHPQVVCYGISAYNSNCMKSSNPHSGIYEAKTSRTLDLNGGNPACNQGGMMVVIALEGNGSRPSHAGNGWSENNAMYTLNTIEQHAICYAVVYDGSSVTSPKNWNNPRPGDPCYSLHTDSRNYAVIVYEGQPCASNTETAYTIQASRVDDHHISVICHEK